MNFQTKIPLEKQSKNLISYNSNIFLLGSCFSENIGDKLSYYKFKNLQNPFGILFHPLGIEQLLLHAINEKTYIEDDVFYHNEQWHCFDAHSKLSHVSKAVLLDTLNKQVEVARKQIIKSNQIIITLGTSWVYRFIETDTVVTNCHKMPQKKFLKELLSIDDLVGALQSIIALIKSVNKEVSILFTVSPVRHIKDGFIENMQSKSHLVSAIHQVVELRNNIFYFPSYEIMMDELRDYRFYKEDMIHPNQTAINYIWERFKNIWIDDNVLNTLEEVETVQKGLHHKPFNPKSEAHLKFLKNLEVKKNKLQSQYSHILF